MGQSEIFLTTVTLPRKLFAFKEFMDVRDRSLPNRLPGTAFDLTLDVKLCRKPSIFRVEEPLFRAAYAELDR